MIGYQKTVKLSYLKTIQKIKEELKKQGFGVLTEIDVKSTLEKKLGVEFDNYAILGVCHPSSAHKVLRVDPEIGLMLPCNVIVYEKDGKTNVSAIRPSQAMQLFQNDQLEEIASDIESRLTQAIDNL